MSFDNDSPGVDPGDPENFDFPVYYSQSLALVKKVVDGAEEYFEFVEDSPARSFAVGDRMPIDWATAPANKAARDLSE